MPRPLERYAVLGDTHTAALVGDDGSIDWLCLPRFDSPSAFSALLGGREHGRWLLAPADPGARVVRREYRGATFVLETEWETDAGAVLVVECMPLGDRRADVLRQVVGLRGTVRMQTELVVRFGYGRVLPWVRRVRSRPEEEHPWEGLLFVAGPDAMVLRGGPVPRPTDRSHHGEFDVSAGDRVSYGLTWYPSHRPVPPLLPHDERVAGTTRWWEDWAEVCTYRGPHRAEVVRSLLVLRALTHEDTGGIVAAATTSLPELVGGQRNWDYRYCWLRDAALTLEALLSHGYVREADEWREWLLRAVAGDPADVQIMYGLAGERELPERVLDHLPGYEGSAPVRIGNGAVHQFQGDVLGEVMVALEQARCAGVEEDQFSWPLQRTMLEALVAMWAEPDSGIWESRGEPVRHVHSLVMAWAAFDRGVRAVRQHGLAGDADRWERERDEVRRVVLEEGVDPGRGCLVQHLGTPEVDAALLQAAQVGFLDWEDPVMLATVAAVEEDLLVDGLVLRYRTTPGYDGLPAGEHPFLACSFWLVEHYARTGRQDEAEALFERLCRLGGDLGLLSEEFDPGAGRMLGNLPQALSHLALVRAADALAGTPARC